jgi:hypothetical protein
MLENGSTADVVANVVLNAITSESASLRYLAGKDIETLIATKRNVSDIEFYSMIKVRHPPKIRLDVRIRLELKT